MTMISAERGEIIEQPLESEVYEQLEEPKETALSNFDEVRKWQSRIEVARKIRDKKLKDLNILIDFYEGIHWHDGDPIILKDKTTVNLIFANIKNELPNLYFQNPTPIVKASKKEFELSAFAMQELLKFYVKYNLGTELKKHVRLCILDAKFSFGCLKVSYTPRFSVNPNKGKPKLNGYDDYKMPVFAEDEDGNVIIEPGVIITSELYYAERISPRELLIDPECRNFAERASWIAHEIVKPLKYLKDNDLYKNTKNLAKNVELSDVFKTLNKESDDVKALLDDEDTQKVKFVEIYDLKNNKLFVLPDNNNFFIREEIIDVNPFSFLKFNESPDNFYPVSDIAQEKPIQQEVNIGRSLMITHARRSARKFAYSQETFNGVDEIEGIDSMKDPEDMTMVKVASLEHVPVPIGMAPQDPIIFQSLFQSKLDFNSVSASTESQRGASERRKTGKEAGFQEQHGAVRRSDKQSLVADFMVDTYRKLSELMQRTLSVPQAIKIIGNTGIFWTQVSKQDIQGELFFEINVSDLRPQIPEIDREELSGFIYALAQFLGAVSANPILMQIFDLKGVIAEFAKSYPSINAEKLLNIKVTPEQIGEMVMMQLKGGSKEGQV